MCVNIDNIIVSIVLLV